MWCQQRAPLRLTRMRENLYGVTRSPEALETGAGRPGWSGRTPAQVYGETLTHAH
jgi:hypothetical protein